MPRRREARALVGEFAGQVGRIEALGVKNVQIDNCDVLISFNHPPTGLHSPIFAVAFSPGEWERLTPPLQRTPEQRKRESDAQRVRDAKRREEGWVHTHRGGWVYRG